MDTSKACTQESDTTPKDSPQLSVLPSLQDYLELILPPVGKIIHKEFMECALAMHTYVTTSDELIEFLVSTYTKSSDLPQVSRDLMRCRFNNALERWLCCNANKFLLQNDTFEELLIRVAKIDKSAKTPASRDTDCSTNSDSTSSSPEVARHLYFRRQDVDTCIDLDASTHKHERNDTQCIRLSPSRDSLLQCSRSPTPVVPPLRQISTHIQPAVSSPSLRNIRPLTCSFDTAMGKLKTTYLDKKREYQNRVRRQSATLLIVSQYIEDKLSTRGIEILGVSRDDAFDSVAACFEEWSERDSAVLLTNTEWKFMSQLPLSELLNHNTETPEKSPFFHSLIHRFNVVSCAIVRAILKHRTPEARAMCISRFVRVATELLELKNFTGVAQVISAIECNDIRRLKSTWPLVSKDVISELKVASQYADCSRNHITYRNTIATCPLPYIPNHCVIKKDLYMLETETHTFVGADKNVNFSKLLAIYRIVVMMGNVQSSQYEVRPTKKCHAPARPNTLISTHADYESVFSNLHAIGLHDLEDTYLQSCSLEPPSIPLPNTEETTTADPAPSTPRIQSVLPSPRACSDSWLLPPISMEDMDSCLNEAGAVGLDVPEESTCTYSNETVAPCCVSEPSLSSKPKTPRTPTSICIENASRNARSSSAPHVLSDTSAPTPTTTHSSPGRKKKPQAITHSSSFYARLLGR